MSPQTIGDKKMKDYIYFMIGLFIAVILSIFCTKKYIIEKNYYPETAVVVQVSIDRDTVTIRDSVGNLLQFKGVEDWAANDTVSLIMDSHGTSKISDDTIVKAMYSSFRIDND